MTSPVRAFAALGDDTRWAILVRLGREPASASALAQEFPISRQAIAAHLDVLRDAGLIESSRSGRAVVFTPIGSHLSELGRHIQTIASGWERCLDSIKRLAEQPDSD